jgi:hypothetical protein
MYEIEDGVPMPNPRRNSKYPFDRMQVGQSFSVPEADANSMRVAARYHASKTGAKFSVRHDNDNNTYRCWGVA